MNIIVTKCSAISITSPLLVTYLTDTINQSVNLVTSYNGTEVTIALTAADITVDTIVIDPTIYSLTTFVDGVYSFKLELITVGDTTYDNGCQVFDCLLQCKVAAKLIEDPTNMVGYLSYALSNSENCTYCNCNSLLTLYQQIESLLEIETDGCTNC